jgi:hypothetical protein
MMIQSLWVGPRLSAMERLSIESFLAHGHRYRLFVYDDVQDVPEGAELADANEILPASRLFLYRDFATYSGFSNFFRYELLHARGGWWVDTDMICLRPFDVEDEYLFATEPKRGQALVTSGVIKAPRGSEAMRFAAAICAAKDPERLAWGEIGPRLVAETVERFGLQRFVAAPDAFCPLGYGEWERVLDPQPPAIPPASFAVHLWNEMWRRAGRSKDARYDEGSLFEQLKARYSRGTVPGRAKSHG